MELQPYNAAELRERVMQYLREYRDRQPTLTDIERDLGPALTGLTRDRLRELVDFVLIDASKELK